MKKAPNFDKQNEHLNGNYYNDWVIVAGSKAWAIYDNGNGQFLELAKKWKVEPYAVVLGENQLSEIASLKLAPNEQKAVLIIQAGILSEKMKRLLCQNLANNTKATAIALVKDDFSDDKENLSSYIEELRNSRENKAISEQIAAKTNQKKHTLKEVKEHSDGFNSGLFLFEYGNQGEKQSFLSSPLDVIGLGVDEEEENEHFTLLQWKASGNRLETVEALPNAELGTADGWKRLTKKGLEMTFRGNLRLELAEYIQAKARTAERWDVSAKSGWRSGAYIMPNGDIIGEPKNGKKIFLRVKAEKAKYYTERGTIEEWRENIARYAIGNSAIFLSIACGLSAPLIHILKTDNFGIHLYGNSGKGKTITSQLGATIYGHGKGTLSSWKGTDNGIINEAISHNDGFLIMDELTQIDPKHGKDIAYALFNGQDKTRAKAEGGNRQKQSWNIVVLSTGEKDLETQLQQYNIQVKAGELVRLVNIPFEMYANYHGFKDGEEFARNISRNSTEFYGTAGKSWIKWISANVETLEATYSQLLDKWLESLPKTGKISTQIGRVAKHFALIHTACKCSQFITGWTDEEIEQTLQHIFSLWVDVNGLEDIESRKIETALDEFLATNLGRFHHKDRNGYVIESDKPVGVFVNDKGKEEHYFIYKQAIREIFPTFDERLVLTVLQEKGRLVIKEEGRKLSTIPTEYQRGMKRGYFITPPAEDF